MGGYCNYGTGAGPFYLYGNGAPSGTLSVLGSRLQKLPSAA